MEFKSRRVKNVACKKLMLFDTSHASKFVDVAEFEFVAYCLCFRKSNFQHQSRLASSVRAIKLQSRRDCLAALSAPVL
jgi:hypothetical protein